ncbi:hypothetical protein NBRC116493_22130 [Aurantivibrio infirmus]
MHVMNMGCPEGVSRTNVPGGVEVRWRVSRAGMIIGALIACYFFYIGFDFWGRGQVAGSEGGKVIGFVFIFIALNILLGSLRKLVNRHVVSVNHSQLSIYEGPLVFPKTKRYGNRDFIQFYVKERSRGKKKRPRYDLHGISNDGKEKILISGIRDIDILHFLEQELEKALGIENMAVKGQAGERTTI